MIRLKSKLFAVFAAVFLLLLTGGSRVWAGNSEYQRCEVSSTCILGEFLYDDSYAPIADADCTLTSRDPSGEVFLNAVAMTAESDGWYHYNLDTTGESSGFYRSQMCCTSGSDYLCLDKSFYIGASFLSTSDVAGAVWNAQDSSYTTEGSFGENLQNPVLTAAEVWSYSSRTLSSFGSLIADIWSYSTRSLTSFGTLVADVWTNATRTLTSGDLDSGNLLTSTELEVATQSAVASIKTVNDYDLGDIVAYVDTLESRLGTASDTSSQETVFGRIKGVDESVDEITTIDNDIDDLVAKWGSYSASDIYDKVKNLSSDISGINTVTNVSSILSLANTNATEITDLKNKVVALKAVVDVNRTLLETAGNQPIIKTWLEEGSIIFKTLITNPSLTVKQKVPLKYYLPREVEKEDIIKIDGDLEITYDAVEEALLVSGEFELEPEETKIFSIEVTDIWQISEDELVLLKNQAQELVKPLANTSYFSQAQLLKADIEASLAKIASLQKEAVTPQAKIRVYRDAKIELKAVEDKINALETLVASASSSSTMFGFIAGIQTFGAWGIIIVLIAGFVFISLYFSGLMIKDKSGKKTGKQPSEKKAAFGQKVQELFQLKAVQAFLGFWLALVITILTVGLLLKGLGFDRVKEVSKKVEPFKESVLPSSSPASTSKLKTPDHQAEVIEVKQEKEVLGASRSAVLVQVLVPEGEAVNLRQEPSLEAKVIGVLEKSLQVEKLEEEGDWVKIKVNSGSLIDFPAWVYKEFVLDD